MCNQRSCKSSLDNNYSIEEEVGSVRLVIEYMYIHNSNIPDIRHHSCTHSYLSFHLQLKITINIILRSGQSKEDLIDSEDGDVTDLVVRYVFKKPCQVMAISSSLNLHTLELDSTV